MLAVTALFLVGCNMRSDPYLPLPTNTNQSKDDLGYGRARFNADGHLIGVWDEESQSWSVIEYFDDPLNIEYRKMVDMAGRPMGFQNKRRKNGDLVFDNVYWPSGQLKR